MKENTYIRWCVYTPKMNIQLESDLYFKQFQEITETLYCGQSKNTAHRGVDIR